MRVSGENEGRANDIKKIPGHLTSYWQNLLKKKQYKLRYTKRNS